MMLGPMTLFLDGGSLSYRAGSVVPKRDEDIKLAFDAGWNCYRPGSLKPQASSIRQFQNRL
jgi:hypothetical protein